MKVILLQDVAKIGRRFEVVTVPDGYAMNKLIPQRQAEPANPANIKRVEAMAKKQAATQADEASAFAASVEALNGTAIEVKVETNAEGKLFEALKTAAIVAAAMQAKGVSLNERWITVPTPIKSVGEHTILLSCGEAQGEITVNVIN